MAADESERTTEMERLRQLYGSQAALFDHLYDVLTVLDGKSSTLLTFNAVGLATISIWLGYVPPNLLHFTLDLIFIVLLFSCLLCLRAVHLHWSSIGELGNSDLQVMTLLRKRDVRSVAYKRAWFASLAAVIALCAVSIVHAAGTFLEASGSCGGPWCQYVFGEAVFGNLDAPTQRR